MTAVRLYRIKLYEGDVRSFLTVFLGSCTVSRARSLAVKSPTGKGNSTGQFLRLYSCQLAVQTCTNYLFQRIVLQTATLSHSLMLP